MTDIRNDIVRLIKELKLQVDLVGKILYPNSSEFFRKEAGRNSLARTAVEREHNFHAIATAASIVDAIADLGKEYDVDLTEQYCTVFSRSYEDPYDGFPVDETIMLFHTLESDVEYHARLNSLKNKVDEYKRQLSDFERVKLYRTLIAATAIADINELKDIINKYGSSSSELLKLESDLALKWGVK